ncbi:MAG: hypothetical protein P4L46_22730 [Fimbriimonas sp.]|nr:hypothetical protein [Fimbriimonas sp.]
MPGSTKVHLLSDSFWHFIKIGYIPPYLPEAHDQNRVLMEALASVADIYSRGGYFVIIDGIVGPWFPDVFMAIRSPIHYIVLLPPVEIAIKGCQERGGSELSDAEPISDLHRQFSATGSLERHVIQIKSNTPDEVILEIVRAIQSNAYLLEPANA